MNSIWQTDFVVAHTQILARSLRHWTGRELLPNRSEFTVQGSALPNAELETLNPEPLRLARKVFQAPFVVVSHGTEADPVLNYGNRAALALWEMSWAELTCTPSRLTAEAPNREERTKLLKAVTRRGFIDDYSGVRITKSGRRFRISRATVWNLLTADGKPCGQAAMFDRWEFI
jgi:hypothetical protein